MKTHMGTVPEKDSEMFSDEDCRKMEGRDPSSEILGSLPLFLLSFFMILKELKDQSLNLISKDPQRSEGLHLSTIISDIMKNLYPLRYGSNEIDVAKIELGLLWERYLEKALYEEDIRVNRRPIIRPGEFNLNGIACSPDGINTEDWAIEEYKCTWKSSPADPNDIDSEKFMPWWIQIKGYCKVIRTRKARLRVFFVNGDYKETRGVHYRVWETEFNDREIEENWAMLVNHAKAKKWI